MSRRKTQIIRMGGQLYRVDARPVNAQLSRQQAQVIRYKEQMKRSRRREGERQEYRLGAASLFVGCLFGGFFLIYFHPIFGLMTWAFGGWYLFNAVIRPNRRR